MKNKSKIIKQSIILFISFYLLSASLYVKNNFPDEYFEQIVFSFYTMKGAATSAVTEGIVKSIPLALVLLLVVLLIYFIIYKINPKYTKYLKTTTIIVVILSLVLSLNNIGLFSYIKYNSTKSNLIEKEYVDPKNVEVKFPEQKQNLIYIYVESLENTGNSKEQGGYENNSVIKNLENLAKNNTNFSNSKKIGGAYMNQGNSWTVASIIGQTSGIPLKVALKNNLTTNNKFIPNAYSLGEILESNGYNNYFLMGSESVFGGRKDYLKSHGNYTIYDYNWAKKEKLIDDNYREWWGFEDKKLFTFAKDKLIEISKKDQPFNFTILTADTHFMDGYVDKSCKNKFNSHYKNSYACEDYMLNEFISWIQNQDFMENTTIVITGDHLTMQKNVFKTNDKNKRTIYNVIINSKQETSNTKKRSFTVMDMYPTTLSALGTTIKGNRLGLGTNLYSDKQTLTEKYGLRTLDNELKKKSDFYDKQILNNK